MSQKPTTQNFYDRIADIHNLMMSVNGYRASVAKYLRSADLNVGKDSLVLDAGSGTGIVTLGFYEAGFQPRWIGLRHGWSAGRLINFRFPTWQKASPTGTAGRAAQ